MQCSSSSHGTFFILRCCPLPARRWSELRDEELGRASLRDTASAYRAIKSMLARGLSDPYTRFITPKVRRQAVASQSSMLREI